MLSYLRKKMKTIMMVVAVLFAATMFYGLGYTGIKGMNESPKKGSIATVNGKEISHKRFEQSINRSFAEAKGRVKPDQAILYQTMALGQVIDFTVMLNEAKRHFRVGRGEMNQALDQIMQANKVPNINALKEALKTNMGISLNDFKQSIKEEILVSKMVNKIRGDVTISPDDLREVKASHILIMPRGSGEKADFEARSKAEEVLSEIRKGGRFSDLAKKYSQDTGSADKGGDLGYFTTGMMVPEFEKSAFSLKPGEVSSLIKTPFGYHIIKVENTRLRKIEEKGKDINEIVLAEKQDNALRKWSFDLRQKAKIEINEPLIKAHTLLMSGKLNEAVAAYNEASMDNPSNPYIHLFMGDAYLKAGNKEFSLLEYEKASQFSGADPSLLIAIGDVYAGLKKTSLALEQYRRASLIAGDNKDMHKELKDIFSKMGASSDAAKERSELNRIEKKEKFEKEIQDKLK